MGASHSQDATIATARVKGTQFALIPCGMFSAPTDPGFMSLYRSYNPAASSATSPPSSAQTSASSFTTEGSVGNVSSSAVATKARPSRVMDFFCATTPRRTLAEYYDAIAMAPRRVQLGRCLPMPVAIAVREENDAGWRVCGYVGLRAFNNAGQVDESGGVLGIFLDHTSHRSWSLVVFRLACRMYVDCCTRCYGAVQWPVGLRWTVLKHNVYCLRATLNAARYIDMLDRDRLREAMERSTANNNASTASTLHQAAAPQVMNNNVPSVAATSAPGPKVNDKRRGRNFAAAALGVPRVVPLDAAREELLFMNRPDVIEVTGTSGTTTREGEVCTQLHLRIPAQASMATAGTLLADSIAPMGRRPLLPDGLEALVPLWQPGRDVCFEAVEVQFDPARVETMQPKERAAWGPEPLALAHLSALVADAMAARAPHPSAAFTPDATPAASATFVAA